MNEKNRKIEIINEDTHVQTTTKESPQTQETTTKKSPQTQEIQEREKRKAKAMKNALLSALDASIILLNTVMSCDDLYKILHEILYSVDQIVHKSVRMRPRESPLPTTKEQPRKKWLFKTNEANEWARRTVKWLANELDDLRAELVRRRIVNVEDIDGYIRRIEKSLDYARAAIEKD